MNINKSLSLIYEPTTHAIQNFCLLNFDTIKLDSLSYPSEPVNLHNYVFIVTVLHEREATFITIRPNNEFRFT